MLLWGLHAQDVLDFGLKDDDTPTPLASDYKMHPSDKPTSITQPIRKWTHKRVFF
jgi:hypothetical protein